VGFFLIFVLLFVFVNLIRFGKAVGFAYQSPPPLYFKTAISCAFMFSEKPIKKEIKVVSYKAR